MTNDLLRRVREHKEGLGGTFTSRYHINKLINFESYENINLALVREKQIKGGSRQKKLDLVKINNPDWIYLYDEVFK